MQFKNLALDRTGLQNLLAIFHANSISRLICFTAVIRHFQFLHISATAGKQEFLVGLNVYPQGMALAFRIVPGKLGRGEMESLFLILDLTPCPFFPQKDWFLDSSMKRIGGGSHSRKGQRFYVNRSRARCSGVTDNCGSSLRVFYTR
jgi:hypothetical protein